MIKSYFRLTVNINKWKLNINFSFSSDMLKIVSSGVSCKSHVMKTHSNGVNATQFFYAMLTDGINNHLGSRQMHSMTLSIMEVTDSLTSK